METILTKRLRLRPAETADADFIAALMTDPGYLRQIGDRGVRTAEEAIVYLRAAPIYAYGDHGLGFNVVERRDDGERVGVCGLVRRDGLEHVDLGYAILDSHAGKGYASEAAAATLEHACETLGLRRIVAITSPGNAASGRVLEKIGMHFEGLTRLPGGETELRLYAFEGGG